MLSCNKCHMCIFHSFIEPKTLGNEPLYYKFGIWSLNSSFDICFSQFQHFSKLMVLYDRLQMLYEPKIRVTGSLESYYIFFMKEVTSSLWDKCNFVLIYIRNVLFAPINGPLVCATNKGSDQPAHMRSLIWAFASRLTIIWLLSYWPISICSF